MLKLHSALVCGLIWVIAGATTACSSESDAAPSQVAADDAGASEAEGGQGPDAEAGQEADAAEVGVDVVESDAPSSEAGEAGLQPASTCGNGRLDPQEGCDGTLFPTGLSTCDDNNLGTGTTTCTPQCTLDVSGCQMTDYCEGLSFYHDDECDACEWMGGHADPACQEHCGADGFCADWYDPAVGQWSCVAAGFGPDPDCGVCGNGIVEGHEKCDGDEYAVFQGQVLDTCEVWSYQGGTLGCRDNCLPDFSGCE